MHMTSLDNFFRHYFLQSMLWLGVICPPEGSCAEFLGSRVSVLRRSDLVGGGEVTRVLLLERFSTVLAGPGYFPGVLL